MRKGRGNLVISRKTMQRVFIYPFGCPEQALVVTYLGGDSSKEVVKLGIVADPSICILREEIVPPEEMERIPPEIRSNG